MVADIEDPREDGKAVAWWASTFFLVFTRWCTTRISHMAATHWAPSKFCQHGVVGSRFLNLKLIQFVTCAKECFVAGP